MELFGHPFSLYSQKAILALYESEIAFELRKLDEGSEAAATWASIWPIEHFPVLVDGDRVVPEASAIIEYIQAKLPGDVRLIPSAAMEAVEVRLMDRIFDNYVATPAMRIVFDHGRPEGKHDEMGVEAWKALLDKAYRWLDERLSGRAWAAGDAFSMADCAAAPALLFAHWTYAIPAELRALHGFRRRLIERASYARLLDESRKFRCFFPLGAPEADLD